MKLSDGIADYSEETTLEEIIARVHAADLACEIIVVDYEFQA